MANIKARKAAKVPKMGKSSPRSPTVSWNETPEWLQDNEYIVTGYRRPQNSYTGCVKSIFAYLHNESVNIHSHLAGAVLFVSYILNFYPLGTPTATWLDHLFIMIFLVSAVFCLSCSAWFHAVVCHSEPVKKRCNAFDYAGIVTLIVGSFCPAVYYGFYCEPHYQTLYLVGISIAGGGAAWTVLNPEYSKATHRGARTAVFIALGSAAVFPVGHLLLTHGFKHVIKDLGFGWLVASGAQYITGALLYANRIPEKIWPGKFDIWFASHQIFHFFVVSAALSHYMCVTIAFNHWHSGVETCT